MNKEQIARIVQGAVDAAIFDMADTTHEAAAAVWALIQQAPTVTVEVGEYFGDELLTGVIDHAFISPDECRISFAEGFKDGTYAVLRLEEQ